MADAEQMKVGYWAIRGLAQPIRMALKHRVIPFEDVTYACVKKEDGSHDRSAWTTVKPTLGIDFVNLPYVVDGDVSFTESIACLTYAAQKAGLHKDFTAAEEGRALMFAIKVQDLRNKAIGLFYGKYDGPDGEATKAHIDFTKKILKQFDSALEKSGGDWLMGKSMCAADFHLAEMIYQHYLLAPQIFAELGSMLEYARNFFALPEIAKCEKAAQDSKIAINNTMAKWGSTYMPCDTTFPMK